jgi:hypothetical protein
MRKGCAKPIMSCVSETPVIMDARCGIFRALAEIRAQQRGNAWTAMRLQRSAP